MAMAAVSGDSARRGDHLAITGMHSGLHSHFVNGREYEHDHPHSHLGDGIHIATMSASAGHPHSDQDMRDLVPVLPDRDRKKGKAVLKKDAALAAGHSSSELDDLAAHYQSAGDQVIACAAQAGDSGGTFVYAATGPGAEGPADEISAAELELAEQELAGLTAGGDEFGLSAGDAAAMAEDTTQGEINRLSHAAAVMQLREQGYRIPRGTA
jgi:hypothetical protein